MEIERERSKQSKVRRKRILVTGAAGKTGAYTAALLLAQRHEVRAFVHCDDDRATELREHGADVFVGDLLDVAAVASALAGVDTAYFCYPVAPGLVDATAFFAREAREVGLSAIVNMSQIPARADAGSVASRAHWIAEQVFDWSGVPVTHLRPTLFAEWLLRGGSSVTERGTLSLPFRGSRHAPIAAEDLAHVIARILEDPKAHAGATYPLFGPVEMTHEEICSEIGRVLGRKVRYEPAEVAAFTQRIAAATGSAHLGQHIANIAVDYRNGIFSGTNELVERIGCTTPTTVARFVEQHAAAFRA